MANYRLSEEAQKDLRDIKTYTKEKWGRNQSRQYLIELTARFKTLSQSPKLGKTRKEIDKNLRCLRVNHHIIFYREKLDGIGIARVLHVSMVVKRHLE